jgi:1-acyl-sn-glycerol-3-phosphate acyltransferase
VSAPSWGRPIDPGPFTRPLPPGDLGRWLRLWDLVRRWHRYRVEGLEHLVEGGPALIVAYHGRPIAHDVCVLQGVLWDRLGYLPHGVVHAGLARMDRSRRFFESIGAVFGDGPALEEAVARGEHLVVTPGGSREGCRPRGQRHRVHWGGRRGYLRLALRLGLPIVPVACAGTDDAWIGLNDGDAWGRRLGLPAGVPAWLGLGLTGLWPFALPLPVPFVQVIGPRIDLRADPALDLEAPGGLDALHARVSGAVQDLLHRAELRREMARHAHFEAGGASALDRAGPGE